MQMNETRVNGYLGKNITNNEILKSGMDVFDGTPLLDIKPYIKDLDTKPDANYGWIKDMDDRVHLLLHIRGIPHGY
jgi:tRNA (Thr-GGU) A37 N-methylase